MIESFFNLIEGSKDPLKLAVFAMGCFTVVIMAMSARSAGGRANGVRRFPIIMAILLSQVLFCHNILSQIVFRPEAHIRLTEIEIFGLVLCTLSVSGLTYYLSVRPRRHLGSRLAGSVLVGCYTAMAIATSFMALPRSNVTVDYAVLVPAAAFLIGVLGFIHWTMVLRRGLKRAVFGMVLITLGLTAIQMLLASTISIVPLSTAELNHSGKSVLWLEVFLAMYSVLALGLCVVMGDNPRQHWRRYVVSAVLVSIMSVSVFMANHFSLRYASAHFELSRLVESLNAQRSSLYLKSLEYSRETDRESMSQTVPSDVFRVMQAYFDTSIQIDKLIANEGVEQQVRDAYLAEIPGAGRRANQSLKQEIAAFYEHLKHTFGLQSKPASFTEVEQLIFERHLSSFSNVIISTARKASDIQSMIRDLVLLGGLLIVGFLTFGVFLPAHRSTINALDALEAEKARIYKLALCAEHTTKGIVLTNGRGQITWCNDAFCNMTGFNLSELEGRTLLQATRTPKADQAELDRVFGQLRAQKPTDIEVLACRKDGSDFWLSGSITPIVQDGSIRQVVHVLNDVSEERLMRDQLAAAQAESERLALIARHASDGMAILNKDFTIAWINPSFTRMSGYDLDDLRSSPTLNMLGGEETNKDDLADISAALQAREFCSGEFLCYRKDGSQYWIEATHTPFFDEDGSFAGYVIIHRDIEDRKALQLELIASRDELAVRVEERTQTIMNQSLELEKALAAERELNRMQTEFVSMASHEFRTPLTIIDGVARRLEKRADRWSPDDIREKAGSIRSTVKRMTMLVERTLDASRLSSGKIKLTPETFNVRELVNEVCQRQREVATNHTIQLEIDNYPETLFGDARLMDNVFTNIVSNAVKYSGESKFVDVRGDVEGDYAVLRVRDHGVGIPKEELPKIFQRFFRASTSTGIPGTGIGLNLVKSLVEMHYGRVELDSVEGEWTEFSVFLPIESPLETGVLLASSSTEAESEQQSFA